MSKGFQNKNWSHPSKAKARAVSVFDVYRKLMQHQSIPLEGQYWTLCGMHGGEMCELPHALRSGILQNVSQFHGVDLEHDVISRNREMHPDANWYEGDLAETVERAADFRPSLINFDSVNLVDRAFSYATQLLYLLCGRSVSDCLLVVNFLLNNPRQDSHLCRSSSEFFRVMEKSSIEAGVWARAYGAGWRVHGLTYLYDGADERSNSVMQTLYVYNKPEGR